MNLISIHYSFALWIVEGFSTTVFLTLWVIARKIWNVGFDISVARNCAHLAMSLRALGSLVGSSQNHRSSFGFIPTLCFCFRCSTSLSSTAWIMPNGIRLLSLQLGMSVVSFAVAMVVILDSLTFLLAWFCWPDSAKGLFPVLEAVGR